MARVAKIEPTCSDVMALVRESCSRVGPSWRGSTIPKREHLRRREAGGEDGAGHSGLVPGDPQRDAGLEQLHDLTGRSGVDSPP